jgi:outer membrane protein TolC
VNEDVALADFEAAVIGLVSDVEQAYWDLSIGYRVLEATLKGRESALQTFQFQQVRLEVGAGRRDEEAQARSQYYQFQALVEQQLASATGLYTLEQRLRYLIGMPATDGRLIRPTTDPTDVKVVFDWDSSLNQALTRRVEVRRQRYNLKRRELELYAARMNRRPRLDMVNQYRYRGLGNNLITDDDAGLYGSIVDGDFQEWYSGMELTFPVGLRAASNAVAHARLSLSRERSVLSEMELQVSHDLANAARQLALTHQLLETNYNRYVADLRQVDVLRRRYKDGTDNINFLLQAQRQVVVSETAFYQALSNYQFAIRDFHRQKGSLLAYNQVQLTEGPWAAGAADDAYQVGRFLTPRAPGAQVSIPSPVSRGPFDPSAVQPSGNIESTELPPPMENQ